MKKTNFIHDLKHLKNHEINFIQWDNCINNAHNGIIYAFSWYLDIICEEWEAIVRDDYQAVMPILLRKRAGISFVYTTMLANQLGVFSTDVLDEDMVNAFIEKAHHTYKIFSINLNKFNKVNSGLFRQESNNTYEFDLIGNYEVIKNRYSREIWLGIQEARNNKVGVIKGMLPNDFLEFVNKRNVISSGRLSREATNKLRMILSFILRHGLGEIYSAYTTENILCAGVLFLKSNRKVNVLFSGLTKEGMSLFAMGLLMDQFIKNNAEKHLTLNLENLAIPDKGSFFTGLGATNYQYTNIRSYNPPLLNRLLSN